MSLTFYYASMSTASITEAVLAELGIKHERIELNISAGDTRKPAFLKINPNARVPVIVHEGTSIWESSAITMYLGETFGVNAKLYPAPGLKRGEAMKWIVWSNVTLAEAAGRLAAVLPNDSDGGVQAHSLDWLPPEQRSAASKEKAITDVTACLKILDQALPDKSFLLGDYSLVDTHLQGFVGWVSSMEVDLSAFANVLFWMKQCSERPALAALAV